MALTDAKCPNCGGALKLDSTLTTAVCPFCDSQILVGEAINNYYITNNLYARNVNVTGKGDAEKERLLKNAATRERFGDIDTALNIYAQVAEDYPDDYRGWYGIAKLKSEGFTAKPVFGVYEETADNMRRALIAANPAEREKLQAEWDGYQQLYGDFRDLKRSDLSAMRQKRDGINAEYRAVAEQFSNHVKAMGDFDSANPDRHRKLKLHRFFYLLLVVGVICLMSGSRSEGALTMGLIFTGIFALAAVITALVKAKRKAAVTHYEAMRVEQARLQSEMNRLNNQLSASDREIEQLRALYDV